MLSITLMCLFDYNPVGVDSQKRTRLTIFWAMFGPLVGQDREPESLCKRGSNRYNLSIVCQVN